MTTPQPLSFPFPPQAEPSSTSIVKLIRQHLDDAAFTLKRLKLTGLMGTGSAQEAYARLEKLPLSSSDKHKVQVAASDLYPYSFWSKNRVAYDVHPQMTKSLVEMKSQTTIPGQTLRKLRHPNPLFVLPAAVPVTHADSHPGRLIAFFVTGGISPRYPLTAAAEAELPKEGMPTNGSLLTDTHDADANCLRVVAISEVHSLDGTEVIDMDWTHLTVPIESDFTLDGLIERTLNDGFVWSTDMQGEIKEDAHRTYLMTLARTVVSHLLYATSRTSEIDKGVNDRPPVRGKGAAKAPKPAKMHPVGFRMGAAIADSLRRAEERKASGVPTGRTLAPHIRSAHLHLYRVGPGRSEVELKWLDPVPVNVDKDDGTTVTLHPMR